MKVSVVIPVYNGERFISETIDSVLNQTFEDFELLVVDNNSTDSTAQIINNYLSTDSRIKYIQYKTHLNMAGSWNRALSNASGKYIKLLCADDTIEANHLSVFINHFENLPKISLITSYEQFIGSSERIRKIPDIPAIGELSGPIVQKHLLKHGNWIGSPSAVMFRRNDLYIGLFKLEFPAWVLDLDMWIRLLSIGNLYVVPSILSHSRMHESRATETGNKGLVFIEEEIKLANTVFTFPEVYGNFSKSEQKQVYSNLLFRLIKQGISSNSLQIAKQSIVIALQYAPMQLPKHIFNNILRLSIRNNLTYKIIRKTPNLLKYKPNDIFWRLKYKYKKISLCSDVGWGSVQAHGVIKVPISHLRARIFTPTGMKPIIIENTPHFKWINDLINCNNDEATRKIYKKYMELYFPEENSLKQQEKVINLVQSFKETEKPLFTINTYHPLKQRKSGYCVMIYDGVHRASIAKAMGYQIVECQLVGRKPNGNDGISAIFDGQNTGY